jgi:hypothetical protein
VRHAAERRLALDGEWRFRLDPADVGRRDGWWKTTATLPDRIRVPGCWQGQGFGGEAEDTLWDFNLKARVFRATYTGTGWYGKTFAVPEAWRGARIWLHFGGVHPSAEAWLNGARLGENDLPFVPFAFEITSGVRWRADNELLVRVHERHREFGLAFSWQGNWSGLYRGVDLTATGPCFLEQAALWPDVERQALRIRTAVGGERPAAGGLRLSVAATSLEDGAQPIRREFALDGAQSALDLAVPEPRLWSPDAPRLYRVDLELTRDGEIVDALSERTGFVALATRGKHFLINGEPYFMRGSGDFVSCPETGCPDSDRDRWRRKLRTLRDYGYNYIRCQSYVYSPEYFDVADEVGLLIQSEMGMLGPWGGMSPWHVYQWPKPTPDNYPLLKRQWDLIVARDVHHPSANLYCMSNEYAAPNFPRSAWQCYRDTKEQKPSALVIWTDGGHSDAMPEDFVNWEGEKDKECAKPLIQHEYRWWSSFPDVRIADKYRGAIRPYAAVIARAAAAQHGQERLLAQYAANSQRLQFLEAKAKMENVRRDIPQLAGICHFNAMDANPSPQGIVDEFYERKYAAASLWRETNGDTVVLCGLGFNDRVRQAGETVRIEVRVSDFSHPPYRTPSLTWRLKEASGNALAGGALAYAHTPYLACETGSIEFKVPDIHRPVAARLEARLTDGERTAFNHWDLWLLPMVDALPNGVVIGGRPEYSWLRGWSGCCPQIGPEDALPQAKRSVILTERLTRPLADFMQAGGWVVLAATEGLTRPHPPNFGYVKYFFTPPANYAPYEDGQNGTVIAAHPLLGELPHEGFADWQFFRLIDEAPPIDLEPLGWVGEPIIRAIHRYPVCRSLAYLTEAAWGRGGLILCALDLKPDYPEGRYLLQQICRYALGGTGRPAGPLSATTLERLLAAGTLP